MLDCAVRSALAFGTLAVSAVVIVGEFVALPKELKTIDGFSNFSNYFVCLAAAAHFAWARLGKTFAGSNSTGGGFYALCRTISLAMAFSACLDFLTKTKSSDKQLIVAVKIVAGLFFVSMISSIRTMISMKVSRQVVYKCNDPTSQTLLLNGLIQFVISLALLTYPMSISGIMAKAYKMNTTDLLTLRLFASLELGLSMMNFAFVGLSDDDATVFLNVRKIQYIMTLGFFMVMQYLNYFSSIHTLIILGVILQFVYILFPKVKEELKNE